MYKIIVRAQLHSKRDGKSNIDFIIDISPALRQYLPVNNVEAIIHKIIADKCNKRETYTLIRFEYVDAEPDNLTFEFMNEAQKIIEEKLK